MLFRALATVIFGGFFGITFIIIGCQRLLEARRGPKKTGHLLYGIIGIVLGLAFLAGAAWLLIPAADP